MTRTDHPGSRRMITLKWI